MNTNTAALKSTRNYGVDTLRVLSMLMIVVAHICTQGGMLTAAEAAGAGKYAAWTLRIFMIVEYASLTSFMRASASGDPLFTSGWYFFARLRYAFLISSSVAFGEIPRVR